MKAINAKGFAGITIGQADDLTEIAKLHGAKGLAFIKIENGEWKSPIVKFFSDAEKTALLSKLNIEEGDCVFSLPTNGESLAKSWAAYGCVSRRCRICMVERDLSLS